MTLDEIEELVEETGREVEQWVQGQLIDAQTPPATNRVTCPQEEFGDWNYIILPKAEMPEPNRSLIS